MAAEKQTVKLVAHGKEKEYDIEHAQRILGYEAKHQHKDGHQLAEGQNFEYKNGVIAPTGKGSAEKSGK